MLKSFLHDRTSIYWIVFHVLLGIFAAIGPFSLIVCFYIIFISELPYIFVGDLQKRKQKVIQLVAYLSPFELLARMAKTSPFIPYELGKYLFLSLMIIGIIQFGFKKQIGLFMLLLIIPAMTYDLSGMVETKNIIFNAVGPINVALAIMFFKELKIDEDGFKNILKLVVLSLISVLSYVLYKTPDYESIDFNLGANFDTSGGFGSNQVSTVFGIGMFIMFIFLINRWKFSKYKILDIGIFILFIYQGLLTFSRGGMLGGIVGIITILVILSFTSTSKKIKYNIPSVSVYLLPIIIFLVGAGYVANEITGGNLLLRYQGETAGTLAGTKEKSLNSITSNRASIFEEDIDLWSEYQIIGVGVGASKYMRHGKSKAELSHIELSRLLAEHGLFGALYFIFLIIIFLELFLVKDARYKPILIGLFVIAFFTTFHAAMRTFVTPLLIGISCLGVVNTSLENKKKELSS